MKRTILGTALLLLMAILAHAQSQTISVQGTVLSSSDDEPLIGASVVYEEGNVGVATDLDGNFTIAVPEDAILKVSYILKSAAFF